MDHHGWKVTLLALVVCAAGLSGGCGGGPDTGTQVEVDQAKADGHIKGMQDFMKKQQAPNKR